MSTRSGSTLSRVFSKTQPFVFLNCNGHMYQIKKEVFSKLNKGILGNADVYYDYSRQQQSYFIPRSNAGFDAILNYFDLGELHMPNYVCPYVFEKELSFWGIDINVLEPCCQRKLIDFKERQSQLQVCADLFQHKASVTKGVTSRWTSLRMCAWSIFNNTSLKNSSTFAKAFLLIKVLAILVLMFEITASSLPQFQDKMSHQDVADYINANKEEFRLLCDETDQVGLSDTMYKICQILHDAEQFHNISKREIGFTIPNRNAITNVNNSRKKMNPKRKVEQHEHFEQKFNQKTTHKHFLLFTKNPKTNIPVKLATDSTNTSKNISLTPENTVPKQQGRQKRYRVKHEPLRSDNVIEETNSTLITRKYEKPRIKREDLLNTPIRLIRRSISYHQTTNLVLYKELYYLEILEMILLLYFCFEYIIGLIFSPVRWKYVFSLFGLVDIVYLCSATFLHVYIDWIYPEHKHLHSWIDIFIAFESIKIFKLFTFLQQVSSFKVLFYTVTHNGKQIFQLLIYMVLYMIVISFFIFEIEREVLGTIPNALYWIIVTMTTVGYGDIAPQTIIGKIISSICAISGIVFVAFLVPIFVDDFILFHQYSKRKHLVENENIKIDTISAAKSESHNRRTYQNTEDSETLYASSIGSFPWYMEIPEASNDPSLVDVPNTNHRKATQ